MSSRFESLTAPTHPEFPEYGTPPAEPMPLVLRWIADARETGVREPLSMALATVSRQGRPSTRTVTIVSTRLDGFVFTTHSTSRKSLDIAASGWASGLLYWRETGQQLALTGPVRRLPDDEADRLWQDRPAPLHSVTTVSRQSEPIRHVADLRSRAGELAADGPLPRPDRFVAYRLEPAEIELWAADPDRLHRRLRYDQTATGWLASRLQP